MSSFKPIVFGSSKKLADWSILYLSLVTCMMNKPAVVFDIDGTLLKGDTERSSTRNPAVAAIYDHCQKLKITCFFVTARMKTMKGLSGSVDMTNKTLRELVKLGFTNYKELFMFEEKRGARTGYDPAPYKRSVRAKLRKEGYNIVMNIGDMITDHTVEEKDHPQLVQMIKRLSPKAYSIFPSIDPCARCFELGVKLPEDH